MESIPLGALLLAVGVLIGYELSRAFAYYDLLEGEESE